MRYKNKSLASVGDRVQIDGSTIGEVTMIDDEHDCAVAKGKYSYVDFESQKEFSDRLDFVSKANEGKTTEAVRKQGESKNNVDLSDVQLESFVSLINVLMSMVPPHRIRDMFATNFKTGESVPMKRFIADNFKTVTNGRQEIRFKDETESKGDKNEQ
jgi:hypothetical protein